MNRKQAKRIFEIEIKDPYNQNILEYLGVICSKVCDYGEYNIRSRLSEKSKKQEHVFCKVLENST